VRAARTHCEHDTSERRPRQGAHSAGGTDRPQGNVIRLALCASSTIAGELSLPTSLPNLRKSIEFLVVTYLLTRVIFANEVHAASNQLSPPARRMESRDGTEGRKWEIADIVQIRRLTSLAISADSSMVGFVVEQPSLENGSTRYELEEVPFSGGRSRTLLEAAFMDDIEARPGSAKWTIRADLGHGVQLYDVDREGRAILVVGEVEPIFAGGYEGAIANPTVANRPVGILAYQWSPDGHALWYSRLRADIKVTQAPPLTGITYDSRTMSSRSFIATTQAPLEFELHSVSSEGEDRILANAALTEEGGETAFTRFTTWWRPTSDRIEYTMPRISPDGVRTFDLSSVGWQASQSDTRVERTLSPMEAFNGVSLPNGRGYLTVRPVGDRRELFVVGTEGETRENLGAVDYLAVSSMFGAWWNSTESAAILGVRYPDHEGLVAFPNNRSHALHEVKDTLSACQFLATLDEGICVRESLERAPELVRVTPKSGQLQVIARPNADYDAIAPLHTERREWVNRYGSVSQGFVTLPRNYRRGRRYPGIVVTHLADAENRFAHHMFQWEYPVQVFAEEGYVVLSVNEPVVTARTRVAANAWAGASADASHLDMQFATGLDAVATMEEAVRSAVAQGVLDGSRVGIAGFSRGSHVVKFCLSLSRSFSVGSAGDASWFSASGYWDSGQLSTRNLYKSVFGGSPYDERAVKNYKAFSPSFRTGQFSGPLLQQFAGATAATGLELDALLQDEGVPTELVYYPGETHLFSRPTDRAAAMRLNLDWFNYWLQGRRSGYASGSETYGRWDVMRKAWQDRKVHLGASK
jgi:dipeptidyl aminopeptidase/acylaminoacyl peptidase